MNRASIWPLAFATLGLVALAVLLLTAPNPRIVTSTPETAGSEVLRGTVVEVLDRGVSASGRPFLRLRVRADSGSIRGATIDVDERAIGATNLLRDFSSGDQVLLNYSRGANGSDSAYIAEFVRTPQLAWLAVIFVVATGVVGGLQGLRSLLGMAISFLIILRFIVPHVLNGANPVVVTVIGALLVQVATLYLSHGLNSKTTAALMGTVVALVLTGVLGWTFIEGTRLTGLASEEVTYLTNQTGRPLHFQGLLLAGLIIGTLGVLDDVAVSQSSAVFEIHRANPRLSPRDLMSRGMRIGRDHIAATVNTLFLAYAGSSLPLMLLLSTRPEPLATLLNRERITVEVVNALVGSLGLIAAVPLTTAIAALAVARGWGYAIPVQDGSQPAS